MGVKFQWRLRVGFLALALLGGCLHGCASVKRIGKVSLTPILHVQVGTTIDVYWPEIEYDDEKGDAPTGTIH